MKLGMREAFASVIGAILGLTAVEGAASERPAPLVIQEQGSFAGGGTVVTAPGTFDPIRHGAFNPADQSVAGQTLHGDHAQVPANARGDVTLVHLPEQGIRGNTHSPMSDLNDVQIADLPSRYLAEMKLD